MSNQNSEKNGERRVFTRHLLTLISGTVLAQLITVVATPLLTRLYTPTDFATLATFVGLVSLFGVGIAGRYEMAIMHARDATEADKLAWTAVVVALTLSVILGSVFLVFSDQIANLIGIRNLNEGLKWLLVPIFATGCMQIFSVRLNWQKKYKGIAVGKVMQNAGNACASLLLGLTKFSSSGMILGHVIGLCCSAFYLWKKSSSKFLTSTKVLTLIKQNKQYPMFSAPAVLLDVAALYAVIFIIGKFYSSEELGQFSLTHRMLLLPMVLVGAAVSQTFFKQAAECYQKGGNLHLLLWGTFKKLLFFSFPFFVLLIVLAPQLFVFFFGETWSVAGDFARIVAIGYWVRLAVSPLTTIFIVTHKLRVGTFWQGLYFATSYSVLGLGAASGLSIVEFLVLYTAHEVLLYLIYVFLAYVTLRKSTRGILS